MKNNEPAFPCTFYDRDSTGEYQPREQLSGMSLRDYFAAKYISAVFANTNINTDRTYEKICESAYLIADAMLAEREK